MVEGTFPDDHMHYDEQGLLDHYTNIGQDIRAAYELGDDVDLSDEKAEFDRIIVLGMGGSALSGEVLKLYLKRLGVKIPVIVSRSYSVPESLTEKSLVFTISYSGNTEETVSAYRQAIRTANHIVALSKGGKLEEITNLNRKPFLKVPKGFQPRTAALTYLFFPLLKILERYGLLPSHQSSIDQLVKGLAKPDFKSLAVSISEKLEGKIPLIYTSEEYYPVAYRFKTQLNECSKVHAFSNHFSELNHNEMLAFTDLKAEFHIVLFNFDDDHRRIKKRMSLTREITAKYDVETTEVKMSGDHLLTKLYSSMIIGDLTAFYLALRYERDPSPVELIEHFKERLGPFI
ncbi:MAG: bifunctional phosphoglucose/phosphomannose isomerase [Candidatus Woesearchaeota archaeon]